MTEKGTPFYVAEYLGHSRIDWEKIRRCTKEEKQSMVPWIKKLVENHRDYVAGFSKREDLAEILDDPFERYAFDFFLRDTDYEILSTVLYNFVSASELPNAKYLEYVLFIRYILEAKKGHNSIPVLKDTLFSYLGVEFFQFPDCENEYLISGAESQPSVAVDDAHKLIHVVSDDESGGKEP